ncbi:MAG: MmcQ/YjbR family DNA-binding protein [Actinomycetes bacterium]
MATWRDVQRLAAALPETSERVRDDGQHQWRVKDNMFAWERPLGRSDLDALGDGAPRGAILAVRVTDLDAKDAILAEQPEVYFTTPHFNGYAAVLVRLGKIKIADLRELLTDAWLARAPKRLVTEHVADLRPKQGHG